ncbi:reverse transcriptase-like protein [Niallia sp. Sow4_A1]|jgi:ribonuclease HI|uniref:Reverse transcriptase-like protein n=1 Tax=Niallia hominis TaxID=3133173 RepID=A0ABV1F3L7_9BACI|nr:MULTISPECIES: reverse transcriptase-like protein [Bacillaceae]MCF2648502.1 reverse transcriptase-like protein [Niallia circulans]CAI9394614.1 Ribonuclease H [Bacillus sp. T2.9-1]
MKYKLEYTFQMKKKKEGIHFTSDWIQSALALEMGEELEKRNDTKDLIFYDEKGTSWTLKELRKLNEEMEEEPHDFTVYFDGGYHKETKTAGIGVVLFFQQGKKKFRVRANELFHDILSNNEAEYAALFHALNLLEELEVRDVTCEVKGDSQVVLKQLEGEWPCYEEDLNRWLDRIEAKIKKLHLNMIYTSIGRNENKEADKLATQSLEGKRIYSKMQLI